MGLRILLVESVDTAGDKPFETVSESLGLPMLAAWLRERRHADEVRIVDRGVAEALRDFRPDVVGLSFVTPNYAIAREQARLARAAGARVVAGGPHVSAAPRTLPPEVDVGVVGEGEATLEALLGEFERDGWADPARLAGLPGVAVRRDGAVVVGPPRPALPLDRLPLPARELAPPRRRGLMTSRGCPYTCSFCFQAHAERHVRYASPARVVEEILHVTSAYGLHHLHVYDDLFNLPRRRFAEIVDRLEAEGVPSRVSMNCNLRANLVDEALVRQLRRLNVSHVFLGLESGVQRVLSYLKPQAATVEGNERAVRLLDEAGIITSAGIIVGSPDETREEALQTLRWLERSRLEMFEVLLITPLPGTQVWAEAEARGLVSVDMDWARLDLRADELGGRPPVVVSRTMARDEVLDLYREFTAARDRLRRARTPRLFWKIGRRLAGHPRFAASLVAAPDAWRSLGHVLRQVGRSLVPRRASCHEGR